MDIRKENAKFKKADQTSGRFGLTYQRNDPKEIKLENNFLILHEGKTNAKR